MHNLHMAHALKLAKKGKFGVGANPMVGCVIVRNEKIIAQGYHQQFGGNHAEINALEQLNFDARNADIYISLEPCSHQGKTRPCVDVIIQAQPKRVIIASLDKNPKVNSVKRMQNNGIEVITGVLNTQAITLNRGFFKRIEKGMPFVTCKIAASLDGKIALASGQSKWITGELAKMDVQKIRASNQAIISGSGTILTDNPQLNVRDQTLPSPIKVIMDRSGKITNQTLNIFQGKVAIITDKTPQQVLKMLGDKGINNALIEAGSQISGAFLNAGLIDELIIYMAPILMGSDARSMLSQTINNMENTTKLHISDITMVGDDIKITAKIHA